MSCPGQSSGARGSCPFLQEESKKNPPILLAAQGYPERYLSDFDFQLRTASPAFLRGKSRCSLHSLFWTDDRLKRARAGEVLNRFVPFDALREEGNALFLKGDHLGAVRQYEIAASLYSWLEYIPSQRREDQSAQQYELRQMFKKFTQENVVERGDEGLQPQDNQFRKNMLVQVNLNLIAAHIILCHFSEAQLLADQALALAPDYSLALVRKAQVTLHNLDASANQLREAVQLVQKARRRCQEENLFVKSSPKLLKLVNLHDYKEAYQSVQERLEERARQREAEEAALRERIEERAAEIAENERRIIESGRTPRERLDLGQGELESSEQFKIIALVVQKYDKAKQFYSERNEPEQVAKAKSQLQLTLQTYCGMTRVARLELRQRDERTMRRLEQIKKQLCDEIYNSGFFNIQVLEWAIRDHLKLKGRPADTPAQSTSRAKEKQEFSLRGLTLGALLAGLAATAYIVLGSGLWM